MQTILTVIHLLLAFALIGLVMLQHGKGADAGAAFGGGASATIFGARGSANFLSRSTAILGALFFLTNIALAYYSTKAAESKGLMDAVTPSVSIPAREAPAAASSDLPFAPMPATVEAPATGNGVEEVPVSSAVVVPPESAD